MGGELKVLGWDFFPGSCAKDACTRGVGQANSYLLLEGRRGGPMYVAVFLAPQLERILFPPWLLSLLISSM